MKCRHCNTELINTFLDLGHAPPSNAYLSEANLNNAEKHFPLKVMVCNKCWLVQTIDYANAHDLFDKDYAYFSSTSKSFLEHAKQYSESMIENLSLNKNSFVVEIASNDGYLLKNFVEKEIPCLGIEPTDSTADAAEKLNIPVLREFFSEQVGKELMNQDRQADLILGNNVYAHVPNINDFTKGLKASLKPQGTITLEFPHLLKLIELNQFDTIYHEHFSYLSLYSVNTIFQLAGLRIYHVDELSTHGGSLRIFGCHIDSNINEQDSVQRILKAEKKFGLQDLDFYKKFQSMAEQIKKTFTDFIHETLESNKTIAGYGAAAKGNTLLNFAGIKANSIDFICDAAPTKQNKYMPGSHIPILHPDYLDSHPVDFIIIFPWNIAEEVKNQLRQKLTYPAKFVTFVPELRIENL